MTCQRSKSYDVRAATWNDARQHCRTPCLILIHLPISPLHPPCLLHLAVPFTFGMVIRIYRFNSFGTQPSYIILDNLTSSVRSFCPATTCMSVVISSVPSDFFICNCFSAASTSLFIPSIYGLLLSTHSHDPC